MRGKNVAGVPETWPLMIRKVPEAEQTTSGLLGERKVSPIPMKESIFLFLHEERAFFL